MARPEVGEACQSCEAELMEIDGATLRDANDMIKPSFNSPSLPAAQRSGRVPFKDRVYVICPQCGIYALGIDMEVGFPFRNKAGEVLTVHDI